MEIFSNIYALIDLIRKVVIIFLSQITILKVMGDKKFFELR